MSSRRPPGQTAKSTDAKPVAGPLAPGLHCVGTEPDSPATGISCVDRSAGAVSMLTLTGTSAETGSVSGTASTGVAGGTGRVSATDVSATGGVS